MLAPTPTLATKLVVARQTIHHDRNRASHIVLSSVAAR